MATGATLNEQLVVRTWERQAFDAGALMELGLQVVYRGMPSDAGGPDYQEAILARPDGSLICGDVEFHVLASDWRRHGHGNDQHYNRVVLHVVWEQDEAETKRADGLSIPILALAGCAHVQPTPPALGESRLWPHPCTRSLSRWSSDQLVIRIADLGHRRFDERVDLLVAELDSSPPEQVLYAALLEALGYASNRETFRRLAETVPLAWLLSIPPGGRLATLLAAARLGPPSAHPPPAHLPPAVWRLTRLRPGNHPAVRLAGAVELVNRLEPRTVDRLVEAVAGAKKPSQVRLLLVARQNGAGLIGAGRADEIAVSVALPFVAAVEPNLAEAKRLYARYPSPPATRWTRAMIGMLAQAGHAVTVKSAIQHQGMHLLYTRYCRREAPADCPLCHGG